MPRRLANAKIDVWKWRLAKIGYLTDVTCRPGVLCTSLLETRQPHERRKLTSSPGSKPYSVQGHKSPLTLIYYSMLPQVCPCFLHPVVDFNCVGVRKSNHSS